jgi:glucosyl-3-phosphoglycerate synthase
VTVVVPVTHAPRVELAQQPVGDLLRHPLLHLQRPAVVLHDAGQLREPDDPVLRQVGDVRRPGERQQVVLAEAVERDVPDQDQLVVALVVRERRRRERQRRELLREGSRDPVRRPGQVLAVRVLPERRQQAAHSKRSCLEVDGVRHSARRYRGGVADPLALWWHRRSTWEQVPLPDLVARKDGRTVSVVVPARNEEPTVSGVVGPLVDELVPPGLVDEVLVVDGRSTDRTAELATAAGARVLALPDDPALQGKGGALWWGLQQARGDLLVFLDSDVAPSRAETAVRLLTPLLTTPAVQFVKAAFDRPLTIDGVLHHGSGGRVTELLARPVLNAWWPQLAGFVQPLSGELAATRSLLSELPFATGYGLEIGMLVDVLGLVGLDAMAQADIGERQHRHHSDAALGRMAAEVLAAALHRRGTGGSDLLVQFSRVAGGFEATTADVRAADLPPVATLTEERAS